MRQFGLFLSSLIMSAVSVSATETPWQNHQDMLRTRIVVTTPDVAFEGAAGKRLLAWEAELADGWKTYWRSPGEAGLPVRIIKDGKDLDLLYPVPDRFELFGLETYGYSKKVLIPFVVDGPLEVEGNGNSLTIEGNFMVCKDICVPFETSYTVAAAQLNADFSPHDIRVEAWLKQTPDRSGDAGAGLEVLSARVTGLPGHQRLVVVARSDYRLDGSDVLAEVNDMFQFGKPATKLQKNGTQALYVLPVMTGKEPRDLKGKTVRLTFVDGNGNSIETLVEPVS